MLFLSTRVHNEDFFKIVVHFTFYFIIGLLLCFFVL